jgi:LEA14-like dessication related protein
MINRILAFALLFTVIACVNYKDVEFLSLENATLNKISPNGIEADLWLKIKNPNDYKIKIETKDLTFSINGKEIGKAQLTEQLELTKEDTETYKTAIIVSLPADGNIDLGMIMLMSGGKITLGIKGEIVGKAKGISKTVLIDFTESISI